MLDQRGKPREVIIPWGKFCEICEALGLDRDKPVRAGLQASRCDWNRRNLAAFKPLSSL